MSKNRQYGRNQPGRLYEAAEQALRAGDPRRAERHLRNLVARFPREAKAHFILGNLRRKAGDNEQAVKCYDKALEASPENLAIQVNRANSLMDLGALQQADAAYRSVLAVRPDIAVAQCNFGILQQRLDKRERAIIALQQAVKLEPGLARAHRSLANILKEQGRFDEAAAAIEGLLAITPQDAGLLLEQGDLLENTGSYARAERAYRSAILLEPRNADAHYGLGTVLQLQSRYPEAIKAYSEASDIAPERADVRLFLGNCLHQIGDLDGAIESYQAVLERNPGLAQARVGYCISQLPIVYRDEAEIEKYRARYTRALTELHDYVHALGSEERARAASAVGFLQPFYLAYQGLPVRDLQARYATTIRMLMAARFPEFDRVVPMPPVTDRMRVGIVSGFFRNHSAWNHFQGLFEALDRSRFQVILFSTRGESDRVTRMLEHLSDGFVRGPMEIGQWARTIRQQNLHALIYPEFGMDPIGIKLGCLRLAPIQLTSWGHPVTSGLETIDYFLSSDLMEPLDGQDEYTERLVRLPNLGLHYRLPTVDPALLTRKDVSLPEDGVMYWCCQSLFKYMPRHDDVFPRIARKLDTAFFVFLEGHGGVVKQRVQERLQAAFAREGLRMEDFCHFLPRLPKPDFAALTAMADVFLDSIDWSGCNSTMEAIAAGVPVVTCPGRFMRGRHTHALLKMMDMGEWIAESKDAFIEMAIRLGSDESLRESVSQTIGRRRHRLYRDPKPVRALEALLEQAVSDYEPKAPVADTSEDALKQLLRKVSESPNDPSALWKAAVHHQSRNQLDAASETFGKCVELQNPLYAEKGPAAAPVPDREAALDTGCIEFAGLSYPRIVPLGDGRFRPMWSVVIPAYRRERYLLQCLASVLAQWRGDEHMEVIVIDNGSEPSLKHHVDGIGRGIVRYHRHSETIPLQRNWNSAVNVARGRWVHLLHDDDYVLPGFYAALEAGLNTVPEAVGAAFTAYENVNADEEVVFRNRVLGNERGVVRNWIHRIGVTNVLNPPAVVIRRSAYEAVGGYSDEILYTTDWELYMRVASRYEWWYEPEFLVRYRQHQQNVTAEQSVTGAQGEAFWRAIEMSEHYLPTAGRAEIVRQSRRKHFIWALQRLHLPLQAGNVEGAQRLLREMLRIDQSEESVTDLFDWLVTSLAEPLWPAIMDAISELPDDQAVPHFPSSGQVLDWLSRARAASARIALARILAANH
jgi:predicted O-linked N-acetylglucosamine transferase (SPINDLY family)